MLLDAYRIKTLPSRLDARDLARLAAAGARPAGSPPLPAASVDVIEVERTVNASGNVSLGNQMISAGLPLAGQRITLRLDGPVAHILSGGTLARTSACPSRTKHGPGCAGHAAEQPSRRGCPAADGDAAGAGARGDHDRRAEDPGRAGARPQDR